MSFNNSSNEKNKELLLSNPQKFVVENQHVLEIIVRRYIKSGYVLLNDKNEIIQHINVRLLDGVITKMQKQYNPSFFVSTYFACVVNNLCKEFLNVKKKDHDNIRYEDYAKHKSDFNDPSSAVIINEEIERLDLIFRMYHQKKEKLIRALKIKYKIELTEEVLVENVATNHNLASMTDTELFKYYSGWISKFDNKPISGDSLKRWTYAKIEEIMNLLNGNKKKSSYDMETLGILFEKYLNKKSNS